MGGGPSGGNGNDMTNQSLSKAKANKQRKSMAKSGVQDPLDFTRLTENLQAQKLEKDAEEKNFLGKTRASNFTIMGKDLGFNMMDTSIAAKALGAVQNYSYRQQAKELRRGGEMITDKDGAYKGVVGENFLGARVYSGDPSFSPIGNNADNGSNNDVIKQTRADVTPERTAEVTPEVIQNDEPITTRYARKRTRRAGQAGTIMEGYGVLTRPASKRSIAQENIMSFLKPKVYVPPPPPVPEEPTKVDYEKAAALAGEAESTERKKRRGRGSTIVAGALGEPSTSMGGTPTLLG